MAERVLNITVDDISTMENWEKEALFKTLLADVNMDFKNADLSVSLYVDSKIYNGTIPEVVLNKTINKYLNR